MNSIEKFINKLNKSGIAIKGDKPHILSSGNGLIPKARLSHTPAFVGNDSSVKNMVQREKINGITDNKNAIKKAEEVTQHDKYDNKGNDEITRHVTINLERLKMLGMVTPENIRSEIAEEFRAIKRPLLKSAFGVSAAPQMANVIMVTSAIAGEGKSFTAINLAMSVATELDYTVLLVDADVLRPSLSRYLGIETSENGFVEFISSQDQFSLSHLLVKTNLAKLMYLPAGTYQTNFTEILSSHSAYNSLLELSQRYSNRLIILDSPPLLETSEARVLAGLVGQLVFVVESDKTPQSVVLDALAKLDPNQCVGIVLNKSRGKLEKYGYYGSYTE